MLYLSSSYTNLKPSLRPRFGYMLNVNRKIGQELEAVRYPWMLDNGAFSEAWNEDTWRKRLEKLSPYADTCIAAIVPDMILDATATLARWHVYAPEVKALGYKAAFATQNGCTVGMVPWDEMDVLFIGGSDAHRVRECWPLIAEAKRRSMWVHVGRVNSAKRIQQFCVADSVDGTHLSVEPSVRNQEKLLWAIEHCNGIKRLQGRLFALASLPQPTPC